MSSSAPYTLLVNTCDAFDDCWIPYFTLLRKYWPGELPPVLLNTERKDFDFPGVPMKAAKVQEGIAERLSWSACLDAALARMDTPLVLYTQEDYFLEAPVDVDVVNRAAETMLQNPEIGHVGLTHFGSVGPFPPSEHGDLRTIRPHALYRISTQAGLWRVSTLRSYLLAWENAWMLELFGTVRSWKRNELFLTVDRNTPRPPIVYQNTGVVKGQWSSFVPELFAREGIEMDFSRRGFVDENVPSWRRRMRLVHSILKRPDLAGKSLTAA